MPNVIDAKLFYLINRGCANPVFDFLMPIVTWLGSSELLTLVAIALLLAGRREAKKAGLLMLASMTISYYAVNFLKIWIARPRPFMALPDVHQLMKATSFSFPSGHATMAFLAATIVTNHFKRGALFFTLAALVCFSRVYSGVHYVSDVISGAALGSIIGYALVEVTKERKRDE